MKRYKFILISSAIMLIGYCGYTSSQDTPFDSNSNMSSVTVEDLIKETNFKLEFKNLNELEYSLQDSAIEKNSSTLKTFSKNSKFSVLTNSNNLKIHSISYTSNIDEINENDLEYLKTIYNFVFDSLSNFMFDKTTDILENAKDTNYINNNKSSILENGYTCESISLSKTSEIKITIYYSTKNNKSVAYKVSLDILQGNKW